MKCCKLKWEDLSIRTQTLAYLIFSAALLLLVYVIFVFIVLDFWYIPDVQYHFREELEIFNFYGTTNTTKVLSDRIMDYERNSWDFTAKVGSMIHDVLVLPDNKLSLSVPMVTDDACSS